MAVSYVRDAGLAPAADASRNPTVTTSSCGSQPKIPAAACSARSPSLEAMSARAVAQRTHTSLRLRRRSSSRRWKVEYTMGVRDVMVPLIWTSSAWRSACFLPLLFPSFEETLSWSFKARSSEPSESWMRRQGTILFGRSRMGPSKSDLSVAESVECAEAVCDQRDPNMLCCGYTPPGCR